MILNQQNGEESSHIITLPFKIVIVILNVIARMSFNCLTYFQYSCTLKKICRHNTYSKRIRLVLDPIEWYHVSKNCHAATSQ